MLKDKGWRLKFNSLKNISKKSKLLQDYNITNGSFTIYKNNTDKNIQFSASTKYPYKLLVVQNKPIENYTIKGHIDKMTKDILLNVNSSVDVRVSKEIKVTANKIGLNIDEILKKRRGPVRYAASPDSATGRDSRLHGSGFVR